jgi:hypothetical protein
MSKDIYNNMCICMYYILLYKWHLYAQWSLPVIFCIYMTSQTSTTMDRVHIKVQNMHFFGGRVHMFYDRCICYIPVHATACSGLPELCLGVNWRSAEEIFALLPAIQFSVLSLQNIALCSKLQ